MKNEDAKNMRVSSFTLMRLNKFKEWYIENSSSEEILIVEDISNDDSVNILFEHWEGTTDEKLAEKQRKLLENYVPSKQYEDLVDEHLVEEEKLENTIKELENLNKSDTLQILQLTGELSELKDIEENLRIDVSNKQNVITGLTDRNEKLTHSLQDIKQELSDLQTRYDTLNTSYHMNCLDVKCLAVLSKICRLLMKNPRKMFRAESLSSYLSVPIEVINEATGFINYGIFPVERVLRQGVAVYSFDKQFKKRR